MDILPQLLINALISGSIYAIATSGLSLTYGILKILNFAHGHMMMTGAYFFYFTSIQMEYSLGLSGVLTLAFAFLLSFFALQFFIFPFLKYNYILAFITTLALSTMLESTVSMIFGVNVKTLQRSGFAESMQIGPIYITDTQILIILSAVILLGLLAFLIHCTSFGRKVRALSQHDSAARAVGVDKHFTTFFIFALGTALAMYAGILVGYETNLQPTMGGAYTIKAFAAMILGGLGNIWGTIVASYILGLVENLSIGLDFWGYSIPAGYKDAFAFVIILAVLLIRPSGLFKKEARAV